MKDETYHAGDMRGPADSLESRVGAGIWFDGKEVEIKDVKSYSCGKEINDLQKILLTDDSISYAILPDGTRKKLDLVEFIKSYGQPQREFYCGFSCENRANCLTRKDFGIIEAFSMDYVEKNFPDNGEMGTRIVDRETDIINKIELYITSRPWHMKEHQYIFHITVCDPDCEVKEIQKDSLEKYTPLYEKQIRVLVFKAVDANYRSSLDKAM